MSDNQSPSTVVEPQATYTFNFHSTVPRAESKPSLEEDPLHVIHSSNWIWCSVHAMASIVAFRGSSGDGGVKFTIDELRQLSSLLETREVGLSHELTLHSFQSGAVTHVG